MKAPISKWKESHGRLFENRFASDILKFILKKLTKISLRNIGYIFLKTPFFSEDNDSNFSNFNLARLKIMN
jgi:hypothetical protein